MVARLTPSSRAKEAIVASGWASTRLEARGLRIVKREVKQLVIDGDRLRGIELTDGHTVPRAAAFLFPRMVPRDELLTNLGCAKDETGWVAAGMGSAAAFAINTDLLDEEVDHAAEQPLRARL